MYKIFFLFTCGVLVLVQECFGVYSFFPKKTKDYYPLPFILKRGEYHFPQKFYSIAPEQRKTNNEGEKLMLFCPAETEQIKKFDEYCLIPLQDSVSSCKEQVKPVLMKSKELEIKCGIDGESIYYDFVFRLCTPDKNEEISNNETSSINTVNYLMYRICYNVEKEETIFTYHRIVSPNLMKEEYSQNDSTMNDLSIADYELPKNTFNYMKNTFSSLKGTFTNKFKQNEAIFNDMKELLLVSPNHMAYSSWKTPVYHFINVKPAWDFTIQAWNKINSFFKDTIRDTEFIQISGTKDVWESNGKIIHLDNFQTITVPKYFWTLVYIPAKKARLLVILHNVPNENFKIEKLCQKRSYYANIHRTTNLLFEYVYYCDPEMIINLYNLPDQLNMLQKTEYFFPLVMSHSNGVYSFPKTFNGFKSHLDEDNQFLFCPITNNEREMYDKDCLIRNENENPYCTRPITPTLLNESRLLDPKCGMKLDSVSRISSYGFLKNSEMEKFPVEILNVCVAIKETTSIHRIISPQLLFNKNLDNEISVDYLSTYSMTKTNLDDYNILNTDYEEMKRYVSPDGEILTTYPLVPPNDMAFLAWKTATYAAINTEHAWYKIKKIWNIINKQIEIQAADENQEFIQMNGTLESRYIQDMNPKFQYMLHKHLWKVIYTSDMEKNIAIIVHNEKDKTRIGEKLCKESTCDMSQWHFGSVSNLQDFAYCCDAEVIAEKFKLPRASEKLEIKDYHLPLLIKRNKNEDFYLADTFKGYDHLDENHLLFCPAETEEQLVYDEYSLFSIERQIPYCKYPVKPFLISSGPIFTYCGGDEDADEFIFNYKINVKHQSKKKITNVHYFDIYFVCFNRDKQETLYTFHNIKSTALLRNPRLEDERQMSFKLNSIGSNLTTLEFTKLEENLYKKIYNFPDSEINHYVVPLFLVSPDDMGFAVWKKTVHHYINAKPSFENVVEIWNSINTHIRNLAMNETSTYGQRNGFLDYLQINDEMITLNDRKTGIPNAFWKIVYSMDQLGFKDIVIIVHNVPDEKYVSRKYCMENVCKNKSELDFLASNNNMVYCCDSTEVKKRFRFI